jgi:hypothetical protein
VGVACNYVIKATHMILTMNRLTASYVSIVEISARGIKCLDDLIVADRWVYDRVTRDRLFNVARCMCVDELNLFDTSNTPHGATRDIFYIVQASERRDTEEC